MYDLDILHHDIYFIIGFGAQGWFDFDIIKETFTILQLSVTENHR